MVKVGGVVSNFVSISIAPSGSVCSDPAGFTPSELVGAQNGATVGVPMFPDVGDEDVVAGPTLNFQGPNGSREILRSGQVPNALVYNTPNGSFFACGLPPLFPATPGYLTPGSYIVDNGSGGAAVGAFSASLTIPASAVTWANESTVSNIPRSQNSILTFNGSGPVRIKGSSTNAQPGAEFYCVAPSGSTFFSVPAWVLAALPVSGQASDMPALGFLGRGTELASPTRFQTRGVDDGYFTWGVIEVKNVAFQ